MMDPLRLTPLLGTEDADQFAAMHAPAYFGQEEAPRQILEQTRMFLAANPRPDPWGSYLAWDSDTAVGTCAFKFPPDKGGAVEIAYSTFPLYEGHGYAKRMIGTLCALAGGAGALIVFAHTLPEKNASNGALERVGFRFAGEVMDPEDGLIWRWERRA